jgi:hypothetical protein
LLIFRLDIVFIQAFTSHFWRLLPYPVASD